MAERYTKLYAMPYQAPQSMIGQPVEVCAANLLHDSLSGCVLVQAKYRNISQKSIRSMTINVSAWDSTGVKIKDDISFTYDTLVAPPGGEFGQKIPVILEDKNTSRFVLTIEFVEYSDGSKWRKVTKEAVLAAMGAAGAAKGAAKEVASAVNKSAKKTVSFAWKVIKIAINVLFTFALVYLAWYPNAMIVDKIPLYLSVIVSFPGFGHLLFRKNYGKKQIVIRWSIFIALLAAYFVLLALHR